MAQFMRILIYRPCVGFNGYELVGVTWRSHVRGVVLVLVYNTCKQGDAYINYMHASVLYDLIDEYNSCFCTII